MNSIQGGCVFTHNILTFPDVVGDLISSQLRTDKYWIHKCLLLIRINCFRVISFGSAHLLHHHTKEDRNLTVKNEMLRVFQDIMFYMWKNCPFNYWPHSNAKHHNDCTYLNLTVCVSKDSEELQEQLNLSSSIASVKHSISHITMYRSTSISFITLSGSWQ